MSAARKLTIWGEPETLSVGLPGSPAANDNATQALAVARENSRLSIFVFPHTSLPACEAANDGIAAAKSEAPRRTASEPGITGKEEDVEVGLQYFGKRYLNPLLGRWISADPLAVHAPGEADLNLYAYVNGFVLKAIDPMGLDIKFASRLDAKQANTLLGYMQRLTRDTLKVSEAKDGSFEVKIVKRGDPKAGNDTGTQLIRQLVENTKGTKGTVTVDMVLPGDGESIANDSSTSGVGKPDRRGRTDAKVLLDDQVMRHYEKLPGTSGKSEPGRVHEGRSEISLGHELIHARRLLRGDVQYGSETRQFMDNKGRMMEETQSVEELIVTGLKLDEGSDGFTENNLRREQGMWDRAAYGVPDLKDQSGVKELPKEGELPEQEQTSE